MFSEEKKFKQQSQWLSSSSRLFINQIYDMADPKQREKCLKEVDLLKVTSFLEFRSPTHH
jgi:hypothetical protein